MHPPHFERKLNHQPYMPKHLSYKSSKTSSTIRAAAQTWVFVLVTMLLSFSFSAATAQCTIACNNSYNVSLDQNGEAIIYAQALLADPDCNPNHFTVVVYKNGQAIGNVLNCSHLGLSLQARVTHNVSGNYCTSIVSVTDYSAPEISCSELIIPCNAPTAPSATGYPAVIDNCSVFSNNSFSYTDQYVELPCTTIYNGINVTGRIERKWWVTDAAGLADTCVQNIYLKRAAIADIVFPLNKDGLQSAALDCSQNPDNLDLTGRPTIFGRPIVNNDACELSVFFADIEVSLCGTNSYNIIRTWTAADWCTGAIVNHAQVIKVKDTTAPVLNCPANITVSASPISCGGTVVLPTATATDNCSGITLSRTWAFGSGNNPFYNVPMGTHIVTYKAEDACGNTSTCTITVTVVDNIAPVNICKTSLSINISTGGSATVPAATFNDGSFDNCQIDHFEAKRSGMPFGAFVTFDCNDINNSPIAITFRVFDAVGNYNDCEAFVTVHDNIFPTISCPAPVTLTCTQDVYNTAITGLPFVTDNCGVDTFYYSDVSNINDCGVGTVLRTWTVVDLSGRTKSCVQQITVIDNTPVQVIFPQNFSSSVCGIVQTGPAATGVPVILNDDCESVVYTYTDNIFGNGAPACYNILRNWIVIDWCTYVPNSGSLNGYYTHTQVITISDNQAPVLTVPATHTALNLSPVCGAAYYVALNPVTATDCNPNVTITNNSPYAISNGANASGNYPVGVYNITFTANDNCGNVSTKTMVLTVKDGLGPTVFCIQQMAVALPASGVVTINPAQMVVSVSDNCTAASNLIMTVSPATFDCDDIGNQTVVLTVKDGAGNISTCTTMVSVQDNQNVCGQDFTMSGQLLTWEYEPMSGVQVQMISGNTSSVQTSASGLFNYEAAQANTSIQVKPYKNNNCANGVSAWDLVLISKHILGTQKLTDPYKIIAADVNRSGGVSTFDMVQLKKIILNTDTAFSSNTSWRFVDANFVFPNPANPFSSFIPESRLVESVTEDASGLDFIGIKVGDVNGSANPNGFLGTDHREDMDELVFEIEEKSFDEAETVELIFSGITPEDLMAYQFTIELDTNYLSFEEIIPSEDLHQNAPGADDFGLRWIEKGLLTTQWINMQEQALAAETTFFRIKCTAKMAGRLSQALRIHSSLTKASAFREDQAGRGVEMNVVAKFKHTEQAATEELSQLVSSFTNHPNPCTTHTTISIKIAEDSAAEISILDQKGRECKRIQTLLLQGQNEIHLNRRDLPASGWYWCQLRLGPGDRTMVRKILVVD
jgi:HYR domain/Dockerin type I domain